MFLVVDGEESRLATVPGEPRPSTRVFNEADVRRTLLAYLDSTSATVPVPLNVENYQDKIRGALALVLQLPSNQLD